MVVIVCIWLLRIMSALTAPTSMALLAPVEEPSTASKPADLPITRMSLFAEQTSGVSKKG
jgi:hypothetical protein